MRGGAPPTIDGARSMSPSLSKAHPLRAIERLTADALADVWHATYPPRLAGRRTGGADEMLRALLIQALYSIPNERLLAERLRLDPIARWFVAPRARYRRWPRDTFSLGRARLFATGVAPAFFQSLLKRRGVAGLLLDGRLTVDEKLLRAWTAPASWTVGRDTDSLSSLLIVPEVPEAMRYLPCLDSGGTAPLEAVLQRLRHELEGPLGVTCWSEAMASRMAPIVERCHAQLVRLEPGPRLTQLVSAVTRLDTAHLAIWTAGTTLLPDGLAWRLCHHHLRHCNDVTRVMMLPEGARPEIFSRSCLHRLEAEAPAAIDFSPGGMLDWAGGVASRRTRLEDLRSIPSPEPVPSDLPGKITVDDGEDWVRLAVALRSQGRGEGGTGLQPRQSTGWIPLRTWRNAEWRAPAVVTSRRTRAPSEPRVLLATPSTAFTGPERMFARLANGLLDRGVDLWALVVQPGLIGSLLEPAHRNRMVSDGVEFGRQTLRSFDYCLSVIERIRPDVIHCNGVAAWPILAAAKVRRIPVIQHVRIAALTGLEDRLSAAQRLIAVSRFVSGELLRVGATPDRVHVCYDGIDTRELRPSRAARAAGRRLFALDPQAFVLLCLARCDRSKRLDIVVRAFAKTARRRRNACLLIVGEIDDPLYFESLRQLLAQQRLEARVRFLRGVEDIRLLHAAADALMLASVREPLGNAVIEAMAMQTPVVATASGGIPENPRQLVWHARRSGGNRRVRPRARAHRLGRSRAAPESAPGAPGRRTALQSR